MLANPFLFPFTIQVKYEQGGTHIKMNKLVGMNSPENYSLGINW